MPVNPHQCKANSRAAKGAPAGLLLIMGTGQTREERSEFAWAGRLASGKIQKTDCVHQKMATLDAVRVKAGHLNGRQQFGLQFALCRCTL